MKKENVINLINYKEKDLLVSAISTELEMAIKNLIYQLREIGPLHKNHPGLNRNSA